MYSKCYFPTCDWTQNINCYACYENHVMLCDNGSYPHDTDFYQKQHLSECPNNVPVECPLCEWKQVNVIQCSKCYYDHFDNNKCKNNINKSDINHVFLCIANNKYLKTMPVCDKYIKNF